MRRLGPRGLTLLVGFSLFLKKKVVEAKRKGWLAKGGKQIVPRKIRSIYYLPSFELSSWPTNRKGAWRRSLCVSRQAPQNRRQEMGHLKFPGDSFPTWIQEESQSNWILFFLRLFFLAVDQNHQVKLYVVIDLSTEGCWERETENEHCGPVFSWTAL